MRHINDAGLELIKSFEGCRLTAYKAVSTEKYYTIGWGHYGVDVTQGMTITQAEADELLKTDLVRYEDYVIKGCPFVDELNDNQFSALVSFCYNCGYSNLALLCSHGGPESVKDHILLYNKSGGVVLAGITRRRKAELELYCTPIEMEEENMTGEEIYNALNEYLANQQLPDWAVAEYQEAIDMGITDGTNPMVLIPRYQAAIMAKRAAKA